MKEMMMLDSESPPPATMSVPAPESVPTAAPLPGAKRVSVTFGDRLCTNCQYNLIGQPVLREPHYDMLILRCPECGTVASVQEYPKLGRWANRWAVILSAWWLLGLLGFTAGSFPAMIASTAAFTEEVSHDYERSLRADWDTWYEETYDTKPANTWWRPDKFDEWIAAKSPEQRLADQGGFFQVIRQPELFLFLIPMMIALAYGSFMSLALIHRRRITLLLLAVAILVLGGAIFAAVWWQIGSEKIENFDQLADLQIFTPLLAIGLFAAWTMIALGTLIGRSIARGLVRILLPPPLRTSVGVLWTTDGLVPPTSRTLSA